MRCTALPAQALRWLFLAYDMLDTQRCENSAVGRLAPPRPPCSCLCCRQKSGHAAAQPGHTRLLWHCFSFNELVETTSSKAVDPTSCSWPALAAQLDRWETRWCAKSGPPYQAWNAPVAPPLARCALSPVGRPRDRRCPRSLRMAAGDPCLVSAPKVRSSGAYTCKRARGIPRTQARPGKALLPAVTQ